MARSKIENVDIWNAHGVQENQTLLIDDGIIADIFESDSESQGRVLLPSGVDTQVHLRVPGQAHKETPETGILSALHGGYGAILTMPNTKPVIDSPEVVECARKLLKPHTDKYGVSVEFSAAITVGELGDELAPFEALAECGVKAFTDDGKGVDRDEVMGQAFESAGPLEVPLLQHAEMWPHDGQLAAGPVQEKFRIPVYLAEQESRMVDRDLRLLAGFPKARYHLLHMTTALSLSLIKKAREDGLRVTAEVSPHHLLFCSEDIQETNTSFKMNPPLHQSKDRAALQEGLASGGIDWCATDHAPHEQEAKNKGFSEAAFGTIGMETALRSLIHLQKSDVISRERLVSVWSTAPAKFLGVEEEFGEISVGRPLRAVLVDVKKESEVSTDDFHSLSKNSCFLGSLLPGKLLAHFSRTGEHRL